MNEAFLYGIGALLICFTAGTFFLSRIQTDVYPEDYEFKLDPFWYVFGLLFVSGLLIFISYRFITIPSKTTATQILRFLLLWRLCFIFLTCWTFRG